MSERRKERLEMVATQIAARGIGDPRVLAAISEVPRECFVSSDLAEFAYRDAPLPIGEGQTISQPYIVALISSALEVGPDDRVLEIGTGSGYQAAVLGRMAREVYSLERQEVLAERARARLAELGYDNVHVSVANGTLGLPEHSPYNCIAVTAGGPGVPQALLDQLAIGGRLVIPIGERPTEQRLVRFVRTGERKFEREELCDVRFVPLIGAEGWGEDATPPLERCSPALRARRPSRTGTELMVAAMRDSAEPFDDIEQADLTPLLGRIQDARVVLLGEATHGTSEFYRMRARITQELILRRGFRAVAIEADWPDTERIDRYVRHRPRSRHEWRAFARFPAWLWRNQEMLELIEWLRAYNAEIDDPDRRVGVYGLDLYSLHISATEVVRFLERVDPESARVARQRYACLTPWESDPLAYGRAAVTGMYRSCAPEIVAMLGDLLERRIEYASADGDRFVDALQNAHLVANAEHYYRTMYLGARASWNLRERHMFATLQRLFDLLSEREPTPRVVVWAHNVHAGDALATEMGIRGETSLGHLCRTELGEEPYLIGFGTDHGAVTAASTWNGARETMMVPPAHEDSFEHAAHASGVRRFLLHLQNPGSERLRPALLSPHLERAIGVIYRRDSERESHYFQAALATQFDEWIWFDDTSALRPLAEVPVTGVPETYPFGL